MGGEGNNPPEQPAVFFDLDGTWFRWQLFDEWIKEMIKQGLFPEIVYSLTRKERLAYQNREGQFSDWVWKQVAAYSAYMKGVRVEHAKFVAHKVIEEKGRRIHTFTRSLSEAAKDAGMKRLIISGSPAAVVQAFAEANGISTFLGTEHEERDGFYTGVVTKEWVLDKTAPVFHLAREHFIALEHSVAVGDSFGDHKMLQLVRFAICFNPEEKLRDLALERGWLIVVEKKDCLHVFRRCDDGIVRFIQLLEYLPQDLADALMARLGKTRV